MVDIQDQEWEQIMAVIDEANKRGVFGDRRGERVNLDVVQWLTGRAQAVLAVGEKCGKLEAGVLDRWRVIVAPHVGEIRGSVTLAIGLVPIE